MPAAYTSVSRATDTARPGSLCTLYQVEAPWARALSALDRTAEELKLGLTKQEGAERLVKTAVDFGTAARGGESAAWGFLAIACLGAAACLFIGLILVARLLRALGITTGDTPAPPSDTPAAPPRQPGGRRASR